MTKRSALILMVGVNLLLLAVLILRSWTPPAANAQAVPLGSNYLMVAAEIRDGADALYVFDLSQRRMHIFVPNVDVVNRRIYHRGFRDLVQDFRPGGK